MSCSGFLKGRRVLRRGSKKELSRRHLEGRSTPFREYDPRWQSIETWGFSAEKCIFLLKHAHSCRKMPFPCRNRRFPPEKFGFQGALPVLLFLFLGLFKIYQGKPQKHQEFLQTLKKPGKEAENTQQDQGILQQEKYQGNIREKKPRKKKDRALRQPEEITRAFQGSRIENASVLSQGKHWLQDHLKRTCTPISRALGRLLSVQGTSTPSKWTRRVQIPRILCCDQLFLLEIPKPQTIQVTQK